MIPENEGLRVTSMSDIEVKPMTVAAALIQRAVKQVWRENLSRRGWARKAVPDTEESGVEWILGDPVIVVRDWTGKEIKRFSITLEDA